MSRLVVALLAASSLAACATAGQSHANVDPSAGQPGREDQAQVANRQPDRRARAAIVHQDMLTQMAFWAGEYDTFPNDLEAAQKFSECLRLAGRADRAVTVSGEALQRFPQDPQLLRTYGLAQIASHDPQDALRPLALLAQADAHDWKVRSALGAALDQLGRYSEARQAYAEALAIQPNQVSVLINEGVSHLMEGDPAAAEPILRQAVSLPNAPPEARQNLAISLALQGKFGEAEQLERVDLPPAQVAANMDYLRSLLSDPHRWGDVGHNGR